MAWKEYLTAAVIATNAFVGGMVMGYETAPSHSQDICQSAPHNIAEHVKNLTDGIIKIPKELSKAKENREKAARAAKPEHKGLCMVLCRLLLPRTGLIRRRETI